MDTEDIKNKVDQRIKETEKEVKNTDQDLELTSEFVMHCFRNNVKGDAEIFKKLYRKYLIQDISSGIWLRWAGHHWVPDLENYALAAVAGVAEVYRDEAKKISKKIRELDDNDSSEKFLKKFRKKLNDRAFSLLDTPRALRVIAMAASGENGLFVRGDDIDQKPWLFACPNGVINEKTGELENGRQKDRILKHSPVDFQGIDAPCPTWDKTILEVFSGNRNLADFFQRICGCALVGEVIHSILVVLTGQGRNGKSLIVETISRVMGQLAGPIRSEMLLDNYRTNSSGPTPDLMALRGLRMAFASETDDGCRISPSRVKWLSGKDTISGRNPHDKYESSFPPSHTLFLLTNHKPHAPADDFAFWERVILIPFEISFVDREPEWENERRADPNLSTKLEKEFPGILAWLVKGCLAWQEHGLAPPTIVKEAVNDYRLDEDILADFIDECCIVKDGCSVSSADVYGAFKEWWKANITNKPLSLPKFGKWFGKRFERRKTPYVTYFGVGLVDKEHNFDGFE